MDDIIIEDNGWYKLMYNPRELYIYITIEYNTDTSAQPLSNKGEDIVRPILNNEGIELEDKEPLG